MADSHVARTIADLPTLAEMQAKPRATPKHAIPTRLAEKKADDRDEKRDERLGRKAAIKRDGKVCRCCKRVVIQQLELAPNRLDVHHVAGRADQAVRWDVRNLIVLCAECHEAVTHYRKFILQAAKHAFTVGIKTYINASKKVTFSDKAAA